ncbi:hypothetical protein M758_6G043000 [Ceratodon purpureus]|uniref:Uncharacterized protein n=1 Tax=Ceratodon purpureus TaxID=3225 RepID=A0A8T0HAE7_CERPU|nr:hypothetical protein KC19_N002800 [Ceratodon purpureus]KAG0568761.1 hypothetical protein KC19_6G043700 [Ceratodon purpureus]KAG0612636.1 hypothetical protein M758_6G043000 [Ceratodon purpureus]
MATSQLRWMLAAMVMTFLLSTHVTESSRVLLEETAIAHSGSRSLLQSKDFSLPSRPGYGPACWPGMRLNCPSNTQVECEVGGVGGCSCLAMEACLPEVSGCFIVVNGIATKSCGF